MRNSCADGLLADDVREDCFKNNADDNVKINSGAVMACQCAIKLKECASVAMKFINRLWIIIGLWYGTPGDVLYMYT
jgi:hypothetical protein